MKMSSQGRKKRVKRSGEREMVYNVYKFMKTETELGITNYFAVLATCVLVGT